MEGERGWSGASAGAEGGGIRWKGEAPAFHQETGK